MVSTRPDWLDDDYPSYENLVASWGYEVLSFDTTGSYQGDHEALLRDAGGRFGIAVIGYGSCSGCDSLEAATPYTWDDDEDPDWSPVVDLAESLRDGVTWFNSGEDAAEWIDRKLDRDGTDWWPYDDEVVSVLKGYRDRVTS